MPMGGWQSCLPPARPRAPKVKPKTADPFDYLSDDEMEKVCHVVVLMENHDWTYGYSDDHDVYRHGMQSETAIREALAELSFELAEATWAKYAPSSMGPYRRFQ
jgi:hypothetical protein